MKISYAVTTHNEHKEIKKLIPFILEHKDPEDELVIIDDHSDYKTWRIFDEYIHEPKHNIIFEELYIDSLFLFLSIRNDPKTTIPLTKIGH